MEAAWSVLLTPFQVVSLDVGGEKFCWETYLASEVGGTALGELEDDGSLSIASGLEGSDDGGRRGDVLVSGFRITPTCYSEMIDLQWQEWRTCARERTRRDGEHRHRR